MLKHQYVNGVVWWCDCLFCQSLMVCTCSVVHLPGWYATWSGGMRILRRPQHLFIMHMNSIFLSGDSSMIGLTFTSTPSFDGFDRGRSVLFLSISGGYFLQMISGRSPLSFRELSQRDFIHYKTLKNLPCWCGTVC